MPKRVFAAGEVGEIAIEQKNFRERGEHVTILYRRKRYRIGYADLGWDLS